jgi:putative alpha-1,2-mannosidase
MNGGTLVFKMGPQPNKNWGLESVAPSMTKK